MSETLGKIEKPEVEKFANDRKLIFVPLIYLPLPGDDKLAEMVKSYWLEAEKQVQNLQSKLGPVTSIFHELVTQPENPMAVLKDMQFGSESLVGGIKETGAGFQIIEDPAVLNEYMDWGRCLSVGLHSEPVFKEVYEHYQSTYQRRNELLAKNITESLRNKEIGLLLLTEEHHVQFAPDIQVFYVAPPELDAIHRYLRDKGPGGQKVEDTGEAGAGTATKMDTESQSAEPDKKSGAGKKKGRKNQAK